MAYEYESKLYANSVIHSMTENVFIETGETKEIKEVYHKAQTLNKIIDIIKTGRNLGDDSDSEIILMAIEHELEYLGENNENA